MPPDDAILMDDCVYKPLEMETLFTMLYLCIIRSAERADAEA